MSLLRNVRYGLRSLIRARSFTLFAVVTLALGIGATTAIFSVAHTVLFRPLPFGDPERIMMVWENNPRLKLGVDKLPASPADFLDWREQNKVFDQMAAFTTFSFSLTGQDTPEKVDGVLASASFFPALGVEAAKGRTFLPGEDKPGGENVVVISDNLWKRRFGSDPNILGRELTLTGRKYAVVGVMPPGFAFPDNRSVPDLGFTSHTEVWAPLPFDDATAKDRRTLSLPVVARLKSGVSREQAQAEMSNIAARIDAQFKKSAGFGVEVVSLREQVVGDIRLALLVLLGTVAFVLLIACANVANLLLAWFLRRQKEFVVRTSLGATRGHLVRQMLAESTVLAVVGGLLGLLLASVGTSALLAISPDSIPRAGEVGVNFWVLGFALLVSLVTGALTGLVPALQASKTDIAGALKEESRGSTGGLRSRRLRQLLIVSEVGLTLVLLIGAGLLINSYRRLHQVSAGFNPDGVLTMQMALPDYKYTKDEQKADFFNRLLQRLSALPGGEAAAVASSIPLTGTDTSTSFDIEGRPPAPAQEKPLANLSVVSPDFFKVLGTPLMRGRAFNERDTLTSPPVALVNDAMAKTYWPGEDPVGKRVAVAIEGGKVLREIVGVVGGVRSTSLDAEPKPAIYAPFGQLTPSPVFLVVRAKGDPLRMATSARNEVLGVDRDQPVYDVKSMRQVMADATARQSFSMSLLSAFAALALVLSVVGVYGVMAASVSQRRHEIGVRMALGARPGDILKLVMRQGAVIIFVGILLGLIAALALTRVIASLLYGVSATDLPTFIVAILVLTTVAALAILIPARRAARLDPTVALRDM
jgi:putative ABC transport system permease protein